MGNGEMGEVMNHTLYGVGVGPGDPELLTMKAIGCIKGCNCIAVPQSGGTRLTAYDIAKAAVPEIANKRLLQLPMPMTRNQETLQKAHEEGAEMVLHALETSDVAFLTLGDPSVYSTYSYLQRKVLERGGKCEVIPGVPSFCAAAAALGTPLVEGRESLHIIPAAYDTGDLRLLSGTKVLMKSGSQYTELKEALQGTESGFLVEMVENCGMDNQRLFRGLEELPDTAGYFSLLIVKEKEM